MRRTTKYVGLDVSQASTVASVREASGRLMARSVVPTEAGDLTESLRGHARRRAPSIMGARTTRP